MQAHLNMFGDRRHHGKKRDYWIRRRYGRRRATAYSFGCGRQLSRKAARAAYAAEGHHGRIILARPQMKKRGAKYKPPPPPDCQDCGDTGTYMVGDPGAWEGYREVDCDCRKQTAHTV